MSGNRKAPNLFGVPDAEVLYDSIAEVYESEFEPFFDAIEERDGGRHVTITEQGSRYATDGVPEPWRIIEWIVDTYDYDDMAPDDDGWTGRAIMADPAVKAAAQALYDAACAAVTYRWADGVIVATHRITWDDDGEPCVNGEPMYRPASPDAVAHQTGQSASVTYKHLRQLRALGLITWDNNQAGTIHPTIAIIKTRTP